MLSAEQILNKILDTVSVALKVNQGKLTSKDVVTAVKTAIVVQNEDRVAQAATNTTIIDANSSRKGLTIFNDSSSILKIKYGNTATAISFTYSIAANTQWDMPVEGGVYTGHIDGIWAGAGAGAAQITELV